MLVETLFNFVDYYRDTHKDDKDYEENLQTLTSLQEYIIRGSFTKRVNKGIILSSWKHKSTKEIANILGLTTQSVQYNKRMINQDLIKELGSDLGEKLREGNFALIKSRLNLATKRETVPKEVIPQVYQDAIIKGAKDELDFKKDMLNTSLDELKESYREEFKQGISEENPFYMELLVLKEIYTPNVVKKVNGVDSSKLQFLVDILHGKECSVKERNEVQTFLDMD